jgi:hypothetical protein
MDDSVVGTFDPTEMQKHYFREKCFSWHGDLITLFACIRNSCSMVVCRSCALLRPLPWAREIASARLRFPFPRSAVHQVRSTVLIRDFPNIHTHTQAHKHAFTSNTQHIQIHARVCKLFKKKINDKNYEKIQK